MKNTQLIENLIQNISYEYLLRMKKCFTIKEMENNPDYFINKKISLRSFINSFEYSGKKNYENYNFSQKKKEVLAKVNHLKKEKFILTLKN